MTSWIKFWLNKDGTLNEDAKAVPMHVVQMIPFDSEERILLMHRSANNRSARNVWSFPSGMHNIGETVRDCAIRELNEEYLLVGKRMFPIGVYENIAGDPEPNAPQWHWVITLVAIEVDDVRQAVNRESKKHDIMRTDLCLHDLLRTQEFLAKYPFHPSFETFFSSNGEVLIQRLLQRISPCS